MTEQEVLSATADLHQAIDKWVSTVLPPVKSVSQSSAQSALAKIFEARTAISLATADCLLFARVND